MKDSALHMVCTSVVVVLACMASLQGQSLSQKDPSPVTMETHSPGVSGPSGDDYVIGADDVLKVSVLDVPETSGEYRVSNTGKATLPLLAAPIAAAGLTLSQFSASLASELKSAGLVSDPYVSTSVDSSRLHAVAITGAVKKPQIYTVFS